ncbi:hypothetical protein EB796_014548 [Bugula neritina]|uniref:Uncharacterized protein n=1 Tax=Bugula neritina TaxID=10212 RepID=A0A7J7JMA5_BUGNE|nr:hypothetical protein EB796_014548 [Bugula neritina]
MSELYPLFCMPTAHLCHTSILHLITCKQAYSGQLLFVLREAFKKRAQLCCHRRVSLAVNGKYMLTWNYRRGCQLEEEGNRGQGQQRNVKVKASNAMSRSTGRK